MRLTINKLKSSILTKGYNWFTDRPNLVGIRSTIDVPNVFNDFFCLCWTQERMPSGLNNKSQQIWLNSNLFRDQDGRPLAEDGSFGSRTRHAISQYEREIGRERIRIYTMTTDPGTYWLNNPMNRLGTAVLKPNQWTDCYQLGFHKRDPKHPALVQSRPMAVWRDNNRDSIIDRNGKEDTGIFGINIHRANINGRTMSIGKWSAGCQVFQVKTDLDEVLSICENYRSRLNNRFTYTLIDERDIF